MTALELTGHSHYHLDPMYHESETALFFKERRLSTLHVRYFLWNLLLAYSQFVSETAGTRERRESHRLSMHTLVQFPVPPLPKIPSISAASSVDQPLA